MWSGARRRFEPHGVLRWQGRRTFGEEYNILLPFVKAHGRRVDPDVLEMAAWGDVKRMSKRLETKISYIRDKFEKVGAPRDLIDSNKGIGYVLKE